MTHAELIETHGTARIPPDDVIWRAMQIFKPVDEVQRAWEAFGLPGNAEVLPAPGNRGAVLRVELPKHEDSSYRHPLSPYQGQTPTQQLESALRALKAQLETGEIATTTGQPAGDRDA